MIPYVNIYNISKNLLILNTFSKVIYKFPELDKYDDDVKFNMYRSLMCLIFTILSFIVLLNITKWDIHFLLNIIHLNFLNY